MRAKITLEIQNAALAYASAVQAAMRRAQAAYAADERSVTAQRDLRFAALALERSDRDLSAAYTAHRAARS